MRVVLQRVRRASVSVDGAVVATIGRGFLLLVGLERGDDAPTVDWMAGKIAGLRLFEDADGRMNLDLAAVDGRCLAVSQFTLAGDARKGRRPSFERALAPGDAEPLFDRFRERLAQRVGPVESGVFGASMAVELVNDGPVTLVLDRAPDAA